jgi:hypothetical protein
MAGKKRRKSRRTRRLHQEPIVREIARLLETGAPTRWRWTSQARHGLRTGLCLKGMSWAAADSHAEEIVTLARHRIGLSQFPSWIAAQGAAPEARDFYYCACCGGFMPDGYGSPWCSEECRLTLREQARIATGRRDEEGRRRAVRAILTAGAPELPRPDLRSCRKCGKLFKPKAGHKHQRYCGRSCAAKRAKYPARDCLICAAPFRPHQHKQVVCGPACANEARLRRLRGSRTSRICGRAGLALRHSEA